MTSNVISWREVIKRRYLQENEIKSSQVESDEADAVNDDQYSTDKEDDYISGNDEYENEFSGNIQREAYPYPGSNQTIVCQVIHSQNAFH